MADALSYTGLPRGFRNNPFRTYSNFIYPRTINDVFIWALWFWERNAKYRTALTKVVSYFVSGISVSQQGTDAVDAKAMAKFKEMLDDDYAADAIVLKYGIELAAMGNAFVSAEYLFSRELLCPTKGCGWQMHLKALIKGRDYEWNGSEFTGTCPKCHRKVTFRVKDVKTTDDRGRRIRFVFRDARDMRVQYNRLTDTWKYYYKLPEDVVTGIREGNPVYLEDTPMVFLEAAKTDGYVKFPEKNFFARRTSTLPEFDRLYKGWGVPLFMTSFDNIIWLQHLDKFNEAITMDYIAPTRIISPQPQNLKAGIDDPNRTPISGAVFRSFMQESLRKVKDNPTTWIISPVPVEYQMVGGEAKMLAPTDLMEWYTTQILSDMGIPMEFRQTSFQVVAPTMGLRMFERQWIPFAKNLDEFTAWMGERIADAHNQDSMKCALDITSFVEDDMNKQVLLQLMQGNVIAKTNVLKKFGVDFEDDLKQRMKEQQAENDAMAGQQKSMQGEEMVDSVMPPPGSLGIGQAQAAIEQAQAAAAGGMPAAPAQPGMPAAPAGGGAMPQLPFNQGASESASLQQMFQQAQQMAQDLYAAPPNIRRQQLVQLKATNPELHAQVNQMLRDMAQQVASDAVAQSKQPQG